MNYLLQSEERAPLWARIKGRRTHSQPARRQYWVLTQSLCRKELAKYLVLWIQSRNFKNSQKHSKPFRLPFTVMAAKLKVSSTLQLLLLLFLLQLVMAMPHTTVVGKAGGFYQFLKQYPQLLSDGSGPNLTYRPTGIFTKWALNFCRDIWGGACDNVLLNRAGANQCQEWIKPF